MSEPEKQATVPSVDDVVLLPCPFCGTAAVLHEDEELRQHWDIRCSEPSCFMGQGAGWCFRNPASLPAMWNKRFTVGVQRGPSSVAKIEAESKFVKRALGQ